MLEVRKIEHLSVERYRSEADLAKGGNDPFGPGNLKANSASLRCVVTSVSLSIDGMRLSNQQGIRQRSRFMAQSRAAIVGTG